MIHKLLLPIFLFLFCTTTNAQFAGNALDFDGANDMVVSSTVPAMFSNIAANDFTIEAWVNPRGSLFARIFFAQPSTTNFVSLGTNTGNTIYFYVIKNSTTYSVATTTSITQNQWTHIAARWTAATNSTVVFFNGVQQPTIAGGSSSTGTSGLMVLGTRPGGGTQYFNGGIDELRVWNEARTLCEIQSNINNSITGVQTNLIVNYNFNQGVAAGNNTAVTTLPDISGNTFNGTLTNFTLTATTSNWITSGGTLTTQGNPLGGVSVSQSANICSGGSYTFPDATVLTNITTTVSHLSTLTTTAGCDSLITTTVFVSPTYSISQTAAVCSGGSYTFPDATVQSNITTTVSHTSMLQAQTGCDSTITTTVNVNPTFAVSENATVCSGGSYTFPDATVQSNITTTVSHTSMLQTTAGCDSAVTTTVNVNLTYAVSESAAVCFGGSYTFPDATTMSNITTQQVHTSLLQTTAGCDSAITTTVNVNAAYAMNVTDSVCSGGSYTFPDGSTQTNVTSSTIHTSMLTTAAGCDSIISTNLQVHAVNDSVMQSGFTFTAVETAGTYQWLDCNNGFVPVAGATGQSFTPVMSGTYAVAITVNGCTDTSACFLSTVGVETFGAALNVSLYPNPASGLLFIETAQNVTGTVELIELSGAVVRTVSINGTRTALDLGGLASGLYMVSIVTPEGRVVKTVVKE